MRQEGLIDSYVDLDDEAVGAGIDLNRLRCAGDPHFCEEGNRWIASVILERVAFYGFFLITLPLSVILALAAAEIAFRIVDPEFLAVGTSDFTRWQHDADLGWNNVPNTSGTYTNGHFRAFVTTDQFGNRKNSRQGTYVPGYANILFAGDSRTGVARGGRRSDCSSSHRAGAARARPAVQRHQPGSDGLRYRPGGSEGNRVLGAIPAHRRHLSVHGQR